MHVYPPIRSRHFAPKHWRQRAGDIWAGDKIRVYRDTDREAGSYWWIAVSSETVICDLPPVPRTWAPRLIIRVTCEAQPTATATIGIQGASSRQVMDGKHQDNIPYDPGYLSRVTIDTPPQVDGKTVLLYICLDLTIPDGREAAVGPEAYALMAQLPDPASRDKRLGHIILGSSTLYDPTRKVGSWDTLGNIRLGQYSLPPSDADLVWVDMLDSGMTVSTERGIEYDGITSAYKIGTLKATFYSDYDPRVNKIHRGTPTVLMHVPSLQPIFTGTVDTVVSSYQPTGEYVTEMTSVDLTSTLAAKTSIGPVSETFINWRVAFTEVTGVEGLPWQHTPQSELGDLSSGVIAHRAPYATRRIAEWLDIICNSAGKPWFISRYGSIAVWRALPETIPTTTVIDAGGIRSYAPGEYYPQVTAAAVDYNASSAISRLDITTDHIDQKQENGKWVDLGTQSEEKHTVYERTIEEEFGERKKDVRISINTFQSLNNPSSGGSRVVGLLTSKLYYNYPSPWVHSVELPAWHEAEPSVAHYAHGPLDAMYTVGETAALDITDIVMVATRQDTYPCVITGIKWDMSTTSIKTTFTTQKPTAFEHSVPWLESIRWKGRR